MKVLKHGRMAVTIGSFLILHLLTACGALTNDSSSASRDGKGQTNSWFDGKTTPVQCFLQDFSKEGTSEVSDLTMDVPPAGLLLPNALRCQGGTFATSTVLMVSKVSTLESLQNHPGFSELSDEQKAAIPGCANELQGLAQVTHGFLVNQVMNIYQDISKNRADLTFPGIVMCPLGYEFELNFVEVNFLSPIAYGGSLNPALPQLSVTQAEARPFPYGFGSVLSQTGFLLSSESSAHSPTTWVLRTGNSGVDFLRDMFRENSMASASISQSPTKLVFRPNLLPIQ